jgi:DNA-binding transcriptional regulator YdaS (Cro superfamily)
MNIPRLFDRAKRQTGSDGLTARVLGVTSNRVSEWRNGHRPCPAEVQDKLCVIARLSDSEIARHVIQRARMVRRPAERGSRQTQEFA